MYVYIYDVHTFMRAYMCVVFAVMHVCIHVYMSVKVFLLLHLYPYTRTKIGIKVYRITYTLLAKATKAYTLLAKATKERTRALCLCLSVPSTVAHT